MKWLVVVLILSIILIGGCTQLETGMIPHATAIPNNSIIYNEENKILYDGFCTTDDYGICEVKSAEWVGQNNTPKVESYNFSFNYSIFLQNPSIKKYYKYLYKYALMNDDRIAISEGYEGSDSETLTVNDVLCTHHVPLVVTCPVLENTTFKLVNITIVNYTVPYDAIVDAIVNITIIDSNEDVLYSNSCNLLQSKEGFSGNCLLPLNSSVASEISTSRIIFNIKSIDGSPMKNAYEPIVISGRALFPKCKLVFLNNSKECVPV